MKILYVIESAGGGSGRHTLDVSQTLANQGHDITLLYSDARIEGWFQKEIDQFRNIKTDTLKIGSLPAGLGYLQAIIALRSFIKKNGPYDIIHAQSSMAGGMTRLAALGRQGKMVYTPHAFVTLDFTMNPVKRQLYSTTEKILARYTDEIICVSHEEAEHGASYIGIDSDKLNVVENGRSFTPPDPEKRQQARELMSLDDNTICAGFIGRLCPQKAAARLLDTFQQIELSAEKLQLKIIGDGPDRADLENQCNNLGLNHQIEFLGGVPAGNYLPGFDFFVLPSLYEGFPYVLLEAAQQGLPIVSTPTGGTQAIIQHGETGFICDADNPVPDLKNYIEKLTTDTALRERMSKNILTLGESFTIDSMVEKILNIYNE